jgi:hypothetical protein
MSWTTLADIRQELGRRWQRGDLPRALLMAEPSFPLRLPMKGPGTADLADRFEAVRHWVTALAAIPQLRIEWREVRHRVQGLQRLPARLWIDRIDDALALLGKRRDGEQLLQLAAITRDTLPALLPWLSRRPLQAIELAAQWPKLLAVTQWLQDHPRPGIHLRQVDIPGVHSKFIEAHRAVLSEWFDLVLPMAAVNSAEAGVNRFASRYGFLDKPVRIRFRMLDPRIRLLPGSVAAADITLDADSFAQLDIPVRRIFITENETNFLVFPAVDQAMVLFGAGYGWSALARARWMSGCAIHYWGDIDTHGFAILDQLRGHFEHVRSFLMDRETLDRHRPHWGEEPEPLLHDLHRLTADERALFDALRDNRIQQRLRLEQERIGFGWLVERLARSGADRPRSAAMQA